MSYDFNAMSEDELTLFPILEDGVYDFEVLKSTRKISKSGNNMCELNLKIWDKTGKTTTIFDYLVFTQVPMNIRKVKHFCDSVGLEDAYKRGSLPEELAGLAGKVELSTQDEREKDGGGFWPRKNVVEDYVMTDKGALKVPLAKPVNQHVNNKDNDVPF